MAGYGDYFYANNYFFTKNEWTHGSLKKTSVFHKPLYTILKKIIKLNRYCSITYGRNLINNSKN